MKTLFCMSILLNVIFILSIVVIIKNKKCREFFKKEVEDEKAFKYFFDSKHIDF